MFRTKVPTVAWSLTVRRPTTLATVHQVNGGLSRGCCTGRPLPHLLHHFLFHFLRRGFSLLRTHHPRVSFPVHYCPATIAPKHVCYLALGGCSETRSLGNHFVHVFHVEKQARWRGADGLGAALTQPRILRSQHQSCATQRQLRMHGLAVGAVHDAALGKAESPLIKGHSSRYIGDCKHRRYSAVLLLVEGINLVCHGAPFAKPGHFSRGESARRRYPSQNRSQLLTANS